MRAARIEPSQWRNQWIEQLAASFTIDPQEEGFGRITCRKGRLVSRINCRKAAKRREGELARPDYGTANAPIGFMEMLVFSSCAPQHLSDFIASKRRDLPHRRRRKPSPRPLSQSMLARGGRSSS
jgi:hypothetical protein